MKFKDENFFKIVKNFLTIYLPKQKCFSPNTVKSYRKTINLLLNFLKAEKETTINQVTFELLNHSMICEFLDWLQNTRNCSTSTRNQRLMALKSFVKYVGMRSLSELPYK
jgi:integrase/recombinase XerD